MNEVIETNIGVNQRSIAGTEGEQANLISRAEARQRAVVRERDEIARELNAMLAMPPGEHRLSILGPEFEAAWSRYMQLEMSIPKMTVYR
jgi:hypothetical protein